MLKHLIERNVKQDNLIEFAKVREATSMLSPTPPVVVEPAHDDEYLPLIHTVNSIHVGNFPSVSEKKCKEATMSLAVTPMPVPPLPKTGLGFIS